ncbi:hypothetical protein T4B_747 [Trichinella pseudospiralis]|uniref:Uncharacterized protein n=1 Tax=Trichinella pseudospiralis TaxID=6337 RepID=A0A0V1E9Y7_TRIPS|nr:hypothetical protein T4A_8978 [Trichinella pseudospiralis]KRZ01656.1 hypothetical protein T4B_747 [Trichinella pseudospiralis]
MTISISSQSMEVLLFFWLLLRRDFIPLYPMLILFSHVASAVTFQNGITDISGYRVCLLHHWICTKFDLAAMDYMSVLKQI